MFSFKCSPRVQIQSKSSNSAQEFIFSPRVHIQSKSSNSVQEFIFSPRVQIQSKSSYSVQEFIFSPRVHIQSKSSNSVEEFKFSPRVQIQSKSSNSCFHIFNTNVDMLSMSELILSKLLELLWSKAHPHFLKVAIRHYKLIAPDSFIPTPSLHNNIME